MKNSVDIAARAFVITMLLVGVPLGVATAQTPLLSAVAPTPSPEVAVPAPVDSPMYELERKKLELQEKLYELEVKKLSEQQHAASLTLVTILLTAFVGVGTIAYNLRNSNKQAQIQAKLKAIDVVISAAGPNSARERLIVVSKLMGGDLVLETKPEELEAAGIGAGHDQNRKDLIKMLIDNPTRQIEVLDMWKLLFERTNLGKNIRELRAYVEANNGNQP